MSTQYMSEPKYEELNVRKALILSILGFITLGVTGILGIVYARHSMQNIAKNPTTLTGERKDKIAIVVGAVSIVAWIIAIVIGFSSLLLAPSPSAMQTPVSTGLPNYIADKAILQQLELNISQADQFIQENPKLTAVQLQRIPFTQVTKYTVTSIIKTTKGYQLKVSFVEDNKDKGTSATYDSTTKKYAGTGSLKAIKPDGSYVE
jgi:heme/copper-type cytochrome/quinol oxidase subunit 2